jgi:hypothetical protein
MSHETEVDYEIMKSLNSLLHLELQDGESERSFIQYREQSKALLTKMLAKLEDNDEYQRYLESEVKRLEEKMGYEEEKECARMQVCLLFTTRLTGSISHAELHTQVKLSEKDLVIRNLKTELDTNKAAFFRLQNVRAREMQTVTAVCQALTDRLHSLNANFSSEAFEQTEFE